MSGLPSFGTLSLHARRYLGGMSGENVEAVRRFFEAFLDGPEGLRRVASHDVVYVEDPKWPGAGSYRGLESVMECWSKYDELMGDEASASVLDLRDAGDAVVAVVRVSGQTRDAGVPYDHTWGYLCRTENGKVTYFRAYFDPREALEEAGLGLDSP